MLSSETGISSFCNHRFRMAENSQSATQPDEAGRKGGAISRWGTAQLSDLPRPGGEDMVEAIPYPEYQNATPTPLYPARGCII
jgi:hypothetical protein